MLVDEIAKLATKVPKEAWAQLAKTACETFEKLIYPLTATTEGIGRLIELRFSRLGDEQKIIATKCLEEASKKTAKARKRNNQNVVVKPVVVYEALDNTDTQTDETLRTLWANLLANEFLEGSVHPEIAKLLSNITSQDALLLLEVAKSDAASTTIMVLKALASKSTLGLFNSQQKTFNHFYLEKLGLIQQIENVWLLTTAGRELMKSVSDPE